MSKGPLDNIALKLTDKLFRHDEYVGENRFNKGVDTDIDSSTDVTKNDKMKESKRKKNKIYLLVMSIALFGVTMLLGQEYNQMYVFLLLFQMVGVVVK